MRVLVTGGAGFIGSNFVRFLLGEDRVRQVTNLDALTYAGNRSTIAGIDDPRHRFVHGDVSDVALVDALVADHDAVVHFAAESHVDRSIDGPTPFMRANVVGASVVFEACRRHDTRVLHISTDEVYGSVADGQRREDDPLAPSNPYAASKAAADLLAAGYATTYGFPITVTRTTNNFGPFHLPEKAIPRFITRLLDGHTVPLYGNGAHVRDWTYAADNCAAQFLVLTEGAPGKVYNVGAGNERSNRELVEVLLDHFGLGTDRIEHVADRPGHDLRYAVDTTRIRALGWEPAHDFDTALARTIEWYQANEAWWRPLLIERRQGVL